MIGPGGVEADASVALPGEFNVANALAAIVALVEGGVEPRCGGGRRRGVRLARQAGLSEWIAARTSPCWSTTPTSPERWRRC